MARALFSALAVVLYSACASWFTHRAWAAVVAGTAIASALSLLVTSASPPDRFPMLAIHLAFGAALLAGSIHERRRRRGWMAGPPERPMLVRHWHGDVTLARAIANALLFVAASVWTSLCLSISPLVPLVRVVSGAVVVASVALVPGTAWVLVGLWRAAGAHAQRGGARALGWAVRATSIPAWLLLAGFALFEVPDDLEEYGPIAFGPPQSTRYAIRVLREGKELELSGEFAFGAGEDLARALDENPGVRVLHLDSSGGRTFEAERVAELVRSRKLTTYVASRCQSACVTVFAAGDERLVSRHALLGLHAPSAHLSVGALDRSAARSVERLAARGIDRGFL